MVGAMLAELLIGIGHDVCRIATTESEAIPAVARVSPDLMIVDADLRQGSGTAAMEVVQLRCAMPHFFMTGGSRIIMPVNAIVLRKPSGMADLIAALDSVKWQFALPLQGFTPHA